MTFNEKYKDVSVLKHNLSGYYGFYNRLKIPIEEIEDIFIELIDNGISISMIDTFSRKKISEIIHLQSIEIHIYSEKILFEINTNLMQKFIHRLEYLNIKVDKILDKKIHGKFRYPHIMIQCSF